MSGHGHEKDQYHGVLLNYSSYRYHSVAKSNDGVVLDDISVASASPTTRSLPSFLPSNRRNVNKQQQTSCLSSSSVLPTPVASPISHGARSVYSSSPISSRTTWYTIGAVSPGISPHRHYSRTLCRVSARKSDPAYSNTFIDWR